ncbi:DgyrCDS13215 [Dimorphilus gyrociliatus]|uniref:DgyrCDS13215 n=1 Tax=Dimorphilus gyrociliatus TaxID=2664684 RepID=A0A7I8WA39_9ANNE|nr:DgyrCDS13215 [Dimorphilus gyrociliatus]
MWNGTSKEAHENFGSFKNIFYLIFGICAGSTNVIGFLGNACFIQYFYRSNHLKMPSKLLFLSYTASQVIFALVNGLPLTLSSIYKRSILRGFLCKFQAFLSSSSLTAGITTLSIIAYDDYSSIWKEGAYLGTSTFLLFFVWLWSIVWYLLPFLGWGTYILQNHQLYCSLDYLSEDFTNTSYVFTSFSITILLPCLATIYLYAKAAFSATKERRTKIGLLNYIFIILSWTPFWILSLGQFVGSKDKRHIGIIIKQGVFLLSNSWTIYNPIICTVFRDSLERRVTINSSSTPLSPIRTDSVMSMGTEASSIGSSLPQSNISPNPQVKSTIKVTSKPKVESNDKPHLDKCESQVDATVPKSEGTRLGRKIARMYSSRTEQRLRKVFRQSNKTREKVASDPVLAAVVEKINDSQQGNVEKPQEGDKEEKEVEDTL